MHGLREERGQGAGKKFHLDVIGKIFFLFFDIPEQMGITILDLERDFIIRMTAVYNQYPRQSLVPEGTSGDRGGSGVLEGEQTGRWGTKEPDMAILAVVAPAGLIRMFNRREAVWFLVEVHNGCKIA